MAMESEKTAGRSDRVRSIVFCCCGLVVVAVLVVIIVYAVSRTAVARHKGVSRWEQTYRETYRPQFHFSPPEGWLGYPVGLTFHDEYYKMHYVTNPYGNEMAHQTWGLTTSSDLVHWHQQGGGGLLRANSHSVRLGGTVLVDWTNSAKLGSPQNPPLMALYTHKDLLTGVEDQRIQYSWNHGLSYVPTNKNPVLDLNITSFRDPFVFWHEPYKAWRMVVARPSIGRIQIYGSRNLTLWRHLSWFTPTRGAVNGLWGNPGLVPLYLDGNSNNRKWLLYVSFSNATHDGVQYFVGNFDGQTFRNQNDPNKVFWADKSLHHFHGARVWNNATMGRQVWIAAFGPRNNSDLPTTPWRGSLTIPRVLSLKTKSDRNIQLCQTPVPELRSLRGHNYTFRGISGHKLAEQLAETNFTGKSLEVIADITPRQGCQEVGFRVHKDGVNQTTIGYKLADNQLFIDTTQSGEMPSGSGSGGIPSFSKVHKSTVFLNYGKIHLHFFLDWSSVEVFADNGCTMHSVRIFPPSWADDFEFYVIGTDADVDLTVYRLKSIWT